MWDQICKQERHGPGKARTRLQHPLPSPPSFWCKIPRSGACSPNCSGGGQTRLPPPSLRTSSAPPAGWGSAAGAPSFCARPGKAGSPQRPPPQVRRPQRKAAPPDAPDRPAGPEGSGARAARQHRGLRPREPRPQLASSRRRDVGTLSSPGLAADRRRPLASASQARIPGSGARDPGPGCAGLTPPSGLSAGTTWPMRLCAAAAFHRKEARRGGGGARKGLWEKGSFLSVWRQPSGRLWWDIGYSIRRGSLFISAIQARGPCDLGAPPVSCAARVRSGCEAARAWRGGPPSGLGGML